MSKIWEAYALTLNDRLRAGEKLFTGIECEIEGVREWNESITEIFQVTEDGSLRNDGREFVSVPLEWDIVSHEFANLHANLKCRKGQKFSDRTSIHVHANCADLEESQVKNIVMMYALFEEFFFLAVDEHRRHNIHCVPLTETYLPNIYKMSLYHLVSRWHKYTALNIVPLKKQGTIEFRHMEGHDDPALMQEWITIIHNLFEVGKRDSITLQSLNDGTIDRWFMEIFGQSRIGQFRPMIDDMTYNTRLDVKLSLI